MTRTELAWVAGLLEGEGCFSLRWMINKGGSKRPLLTVVCSMTDEDVIRRLHRLVGIGAVYLKPSRDGYKAAWEWACARMPLVKELIRRLRPLMGKRRSAKIGVMLKAARNFKPQRVRKHGGTAFYGAGCRCRVCVQCHNKRHREYIRDCKAGRRVRRSRGAVSPTRYNIEHVEQAGAAPDRAP